MWLQMTMLLRTQSLSTLFHWRACLVLAEDNPADVHTGHSSRAATFTTFLDFHLFHPLLSLADALSRPT